MAAVGCRGSGASTIATASTAALVTELMKAASVTVSCRPVSVNVVFRGRKPERTLERLPLGGEYESS